MKSISTLRIFANTRHLPPAGCFRKYTAASADNGGAEDAKTKILNAALSHVRNHGWSEKSIIQGASDHGYSTTAHGMFPRGGTDLALHFYRSSNKQLFDKLSAELKEVEEAEEKTKKSTGKFVRDALEDRIRMTSEHRDNWHEAMALLAHPSAACEALDLLGHLVDDIWYLAGDKSHDMDWYTKRASLAFIYKTTELFMLQDKSVDFADTWRCLDRRFEDVGFVGSTISTTRDLAQGLWNGGLRSGLTVLQNMSGMNPR